MENKDQLLLEAKRRFLTYEPYPKQKEFHNITVKNKVIGGGNQRIPLTSHILTPNGWRVSGDLKVGDKVFTHTGAVAKIKVISDTCNAPLYEIGFNDGTTALASDDHRWLVRDRVGHEMVRMTTELHPIYHKIPLPTGIEYGTKKLPMPAYLFGLYLGNGWLDRNNYCIKLSDSYDRYLEISKMFRCSSFDKQTQTFKVWNTSGYLKFLESVGHAKEKYIPEIYLRSSIKQRKELLAGLIDSDGGIDSLGRVSYYTSSQELAEGVLDLMRGLSCKVRLTVRTRKTNFGTTKEFTIRGRCPFKPNKLSHKHEWKCSDRLDYKTKTITYVKLIGSEYQRCYAVDHDDHTFIIDDYVCTHNTGKTICGTFEVAMQATQCFPDWHQGWRIPGHIDATSGQKVRVIIVCSTDSKTLRDSIQKKLVGMDTDGYTSGSIAPDWIVKDSAVKARGVGGGLLDSIQVRATDGLITTIYFRVYSQGRENLQSLTADLVYCDEEPPQTVYGELMGRIAGTNGYFMMAFTPLNGMTPLVQSFWRRDDPKKGLVIMSVFDVGHISQEGIDSLVSMYSGLNAAEREARLYGVPSAGMGQVYPITDDRLAVDAFDIPRNWKRIAGLDFGRGIHPAACVWIAVAPDDTVYVYDCFKGAGLADSEIASKILARGNNVPVAFPHDFMRNTGISTIGDERKSEGWTYKEVYERFGIKFTPHCAKDENESVRVEAGLIKIRQAMLDGKFFVFRNLQGIFEEKATYHYQDDGAPVGTNDDLMDAMRYAYVMRRYAESPIETLLMMGRINEVATDNTLDYRED